LSGVLATRSEVIDVLSNLGWSGVVIILVALLLIFGPSKLPEIGRAFGRSLREFRNATTGMMEGFSETKSDGKTQSQAGSTDSRGHGPGATAPVEPIELKDVQSPQAKGDEAGTKPS
jgi:sec-independent protein translocase protein TatA